MKSRQTKITDFFTAFHQEASKLFDVVEAAGEAGGYLEWANGRVGEAEVFFLWFPKARRLVYVINKEQREEGEVDADTPIEVASKIVAKIRQQ